MNKTICLLFIALFAFAFVNAETALSVEHSYPPAKKANCYLLTQTCDNCTYVNITAIADPQGQLALASSVSMNKVNGTLWSYNFCNLTKIGDYVVYTIGDLDGVITSDNPKLPVTSTGNTNDLYIPLILLIGSVVIFIVALIYKNEYFGLMAGFLFVLSGIYLIIYGLGVIADMYTRSVGFISMGIGILVFFISIFEMFSDGGDAGFTDE